MVRMCFQHSCCKVLQSPAACLGAHPTSPTRRLLVERQVCAPTQVPHRHAQPASAQTRRRAPGAGPAPPVSASGRLSRAHCGPCARAARRMRPHRPRRGGRCAARAARARPRLPAARLRPPCKLGQRRAAGRSVRRTARPPPHTRAARRPPPRALQGGPEPQQAGLALLGHHCRPCHSRTLRAPVHRRRQARGAQSAHCRERSRSGGWADSSQQAPPLLCTRMRTLRGARRTGALGSGAAKRSPHRPHSRLHLRSSGLAQRRLSALLRQKVQASRWDAILARSPSRALRLSRSRPPQRWRRPPPRHCGAAAAVLREGRSGSPENAPPRTLSLPSICAAAHAAWQRIDATSRSPAAMQGGACRCLTLMSQRQQTCPKSKPERSI